MWPGSREQANHPPLSSESSPRRARDATICIAPCTLDADSSSEKIGKCKNGRQIILKELRWHSGSFPLRLAWRTDTGHTRAEPVMSLCYSCPSLSSSPDRQSAGILRGFKRPSTPEDRAAGSPAGGCRDPVLGRRAPSAQSRFGSATRKTTGALVPLAASGSSIVADSQV